MKSSKIFAFVTAAGISCFMLLSSNYRAATISPENSATGCIKKNCEETARENDKQLAKVLPEKILQLLQ